VATTITVDPITRIEGHLGIEVDVDSVGGEQQVVEARSNGTLFRGFEVVMIGRDPRDASQYSQRICGVCPVSHALAACLNLESAFGVAPPDNGRILRNLVLAANFIQSHLLHFYHLSMVDFVDTSAVLEGAPWTPGYSSPDMVTGEVASTMAQHYLAAFEMRRKAHQMGAVFGGKLPCTGAFVAGGCTEVVTTDKVADFRALLDELRAFVDAVYVADATLLAGLFPAYSDLGAGHGDLLAFGVFDLDASGSSRLFDGGRIEAGTPGAIDLAQISEHLKYSWYSSSGAGLHPDSGVTEPDPDKPGAYTWLKAPRYEDHPYELGPLARMRVNGLYAGGVSVMDRIVARALETQVIADAMDGWLDELEPGQPGYQPSAVPLQASGVGLTEAPRGALGHWMDVEDGVISRYQVVTPTNWNASPRDDSDVAGPLEEALVGTPVADLDQPVEVIRVVHSFDPCLACAVHVLRPGEHVDSSRVVLRPGQGPGVAP